ncbi:metabotropic glutamate receptor 1-like [Planococcus citri]|uniref:metabotropic glutamate receptor 1-like n=1 Tax=Planococcus citri TaxID=170843 RepID=UPI0031F9AF63
MDLIHISYTGPSKISFNMEEIESLRAIFSTSGHFFILDVMFEILAYYQWRHVTLIGSNDFIGYDYQKSNFVRRARELAAAYEICIGHTVNTYQLRHYGIYGSELLRHERASLNITDVIICYCDKNDIITLKNELVKVNRTVTPAKVVVIAGSTDESWKYEEIIWEPKLGDLYYVTPAMDQYPKEFHDYFTSLSAENLTKHSYLKKFRQRYFKSKTSNNKNANTIYKTICKNNSRVFSIIKSVYAIAHGMMDKLARLKLEYGLINFFLFGQEVGFTRKRLPSMEKFDIYKYQATNNTEIHHLTKVAKYLKYRDKDEPWQYEGVYRIRGNLTVLNEKLFQYSKSYVKSECSEPCLPGHLKIISGTDQCCWSCAPCDALERTDLHQTSCIKCEDGQMPDENQQDCVFISTRIQEPTEWYNWQNLICMCFSSSSIILTIIVSIIFIKQRNTPVVKSTTKELCYVMFAGIALANITIFISVLSQEFKTSAVKVLPATGFTTIYAALLMKTIRIARILPKSENSFPNMHPKFVSITAQIITTVALIGVESLICWHAVQANDTYLSTEKNTLNYVLKNYYLNGFFLMRIFGFVGVLILFCMYFAVKTRNLPGNYNETKHIALSIFTTIAISMFFCFMYVISEYKILLVNLAISINSLSVLVFLFFPKLNIILRRPERNTKAYYTTVALNIRKHVREEPHQQQQ